MENNATGKEEAKTGARKRAKRAEIYLLFSTVTSPWPELRNSSVSGRFTITLASLLVNTHVAVPGLKSKMPAVLLLIPN